MFAGKNLRMTKKGSRIDLMKKRRCVKNRCACAAAKHKIILSWPNRTKI